MRLPNWFKYVGASNHYWNLGVTPNYRRAIIAYAANYYKSCLIARQVQGALFAIDGQWINLNYDYIKETWSAVNIRRVMTGTRHCTMGILVSQFQMMAKEGCETVTPVVLGDDVGSTTAVPLPRY